MAAAYVVVPVTYRSMPPFSAAIEFLRLGAVQFQFK